MSEILIDRTGQPQLVAASDGSLMVTVPIRIKRRGLRKAVILPDGEGLELRPLGHRTDTASAGTRPRAPLAGHAGIG